MAVLTTEQRNALPDSDFAVHSKRVLPIQDKDHVRMAWNMLDVTKGLTEQEKTEARKRILERAKEFGINTDNWQANAGAHMRLQDPGEHNGGPVPMRFQAMALEVPTVEGHPNRVPFSGILTRLDSPSDAPVGGANGKRVMIPKAVAEAALDSLALMAVDYTGDLSGHDPQAKIGVITAAKIVGDAIEIEGFLYGADFPAVVADIQARKATLGFSYEAQASVEDWSQNPVEVTSCVFTGAAILLKDKAAYTSTSLSANAVPEISDMDAKEILEKLTALEAQNKDLKEQITKMQASSVLDKVKPHSDRLREAADLMEKEGMGAHDKRGHVRHLREMADRMDSDAVLGKLPHIMYTDNWFDAAADKEEKDKLAKCIQDLEKELEDAKKEREKLEAAAFAAAGAPARQTFVPGVVGKPALQASGGRPDLKTMDAELKASGASTTERLAQLLMAQTGA